MFGVPNKKMTNNLTPRSHVQMMMLLLLLLLSRCESVVKGWRLGEGRKRMKWNEAHKQTNTMTFR